MSAGRRGLPRRATARFSPLVTGGADAAPGRRLEVVELLPMAEEALRPLAGGVVHVCAEGRGCRLLRAVAAQAGSGRHVGPSLDFVRVPCNVPPNLLKAAEQVRLMAGVTRHSLMLTALPLSPGYPHRMARPAEARIVLHEVIGTGNSECSQPDGRHAQGRQNHEP
jgi:hypothetical protein